MGLRTSDDEKDTFARVEVRPKWAAGLTNRMMLCRSEWRKALAPAKHHYGSGPTSVCSVDDCSGEGLYGGLDCLDVSPCDVFETVTG